MKIKKKKVHMLEENCETKEGIFKTGDRQHSYILMRKLVLQLGEITI